MLAPGDDQDRRGDQQYGLDYKLAGCSGSGMIAELTRAENEKKPVVVTGWIPHWMFANGS